MIRLAGFALEILLIIFIAYAYSGKLLLDFDVTKLQQTGEHNENSTLPLLAEIGLSRYKVIPLWNPFLMTGFPHAGDFFNHFWNPISTIPILLWGGINGLKVSIFLTFIIAGAGQWAFGYVIGLRRLFRVWSAILFMISGGLALLWRVGWLALLLGIAWFPWCFATLLRALQKPTIPRIAFSSLAIFMVVSTGSGYYLAYLFVCLAVISIVDLLRAKPRNRLVKIRSIVLIVLLSAALSAVVIVPYLDNFHYTARDAGFDVEQDFSQPIQYGLINYIIYTFEWFDTNILGTAGGWNWFYIGWLPVAALAFIPLAFSRSRRQRWTILMNGVLFLILMMWFANRYSPIKQIYEWLPILYIFRFPNRLLILATSPLLILSAQGLEYVYRASTVRVKHVKIPYAPRGQWSKILTSKRLVSLYWIIVLVLTTKAVYDVNKKFAFVDQYLDPEPFVVLQWLKSYDSSLYYVNIGGEDIAWAWTPAAYWLEMPVINFQHNRHLLGLDLQRAESSPFIATAKYYICLADQPRPGQAQILRSFNGENVWYIPDALPYAFSVQPALLDKHSPSLYDNVTAMEVHLRGPNQVEVKGTPQQDGDVLVVLMSDYPGWKLVIDGKPAKVTPFNGYLGSRLLPGEHIYRFYFQPIQYIIGATISFTAFLFMIVFLLISLYQTANHKLHS